jgi:hypothetical protein
MTDDDGRDPSARFAGICVLALLIVIFGLFGLLLWAAL